MPDLEDVWVFNLWMKVKSFERHYATLMMDCKDGNALFIIHLSLCWTEVIYRPPLSIVYVIVCNKFIFLYVFLLIVKHLNKVSSGFSNVINKALHHKPHVKTFFIGGTLTIKVVAKNKGYKIKINCTKSASVFTRFFFQINFISQLTSYKALS